MKVKVQFWQEDKPEVGKRILLESYEFDFGDSAMWNKFREEMFQRCIKGISTGATIRISDD